MSGPRRFDPGELGSDRTPDLDDAAEIARWLQAAGESPVSPSADFGDRVMAALADEPSPAPAGFLAPLHRRGLLGGFVTSVRQAWQSMGGAGRPIFVRAPALAYVLVVAIAGTALAGVATVGVAGALGVFRPGPTPSLEPVTPGPTLAPPATVAPNPSDQLPAESAPPVPGRSDDASSSPNGTDDHGGNSGPGSSGSGSGSGSGSDDNSGPGSSGSGSGGSDSGSTQTPKPSATTRPTGTPKPSETPH